MEQDPLEPGSSGSYEFSQAEEAEFRGLARSMRFVGGATMWGGLGAGALAAVVQFVQNDHPNMLAWAFVAVINVAIGFLLLSAGASFRAISETRGRDVQHLMGAIRRLRRVYGVHASVIIGGMILVAAAVLMGLAHC
jgi:hypothetical protein